MRRRTRHRSNSHLAPFICAGLVAAAIATVCGADPSATMTEYNLARRALIQETFVEVYLRRAEAAGVVNAKALQVIEAVADEESDKPKRLGLRGKWVTANQARDAGCDDPIFLYAMARIVDDVELTEQALDGMIERGYPALWRAAAARRLAGLLKGKGQDERIAELDALFADAMIESIESDEYGPGRERLLIDDLRPLLYGDASREVAASFCDRLEAMEGVDPWLADLCRGILELRLAWDARGTSWAHTVTDEQWALFREHIDRAYPALVRAHEAAPDRPEAATFLLRLTMVAGQQDEHDERYWFDQAIAAQIDWPSAWNQMLIALLPRWGGSYRAMYELGLEAKATGRYDTIVPRNLLWAILMIADDDETVRYWHELDVHDPVVAMLETYRDRDETLMYQVDRDYWSTHIVALEWWLGDLAAAAAEAEAQHTRYSRLAIEEANLTREELLGDLRVYRSPIRDRVIAAYDRLHEDDAPGTIEGLQEARAALAPGADVKEQRLNDSIRSWIDDRLASLQVSAALEDGAWVPLRFDEQLSGWTVVHGSWERVDDRTVTATPDKDGMLLMLDAPIGWRYEIRGSASCPPRSDRLQSINASVMVHGFRGFQKYDWEAVAFYPGQGLAVIQRRWAKSERVEGPATMADTFDFHVQLWDGYVAAYIDGALVMAASTPGGGFYWRPGPQAGIGAALWYKTHPYRFSDVEIRLLEECPAAVTELIAQDDDVDELPPEM